MALICSAAVLLPSLLNLQPERQHGLLFFPKNPQKKGRVYQASMQAASSETMGVQEMPFLTPHKQIIAPCTHLFKSQKDYYIYGTSTTIPTFGHSH